MRKRKVESEEIRKVSEVPFGEFIRTVAPKTGKAFSTVYILDGYDRSTRMYEAYAAEDVNRCIYLKPDRQVLVGFTY